MTPDQESKLLSSEEKEFVYRLATHYAPTPMTPAHQIAFDRALEERISHQTRPSFFRPVAALATACAALLIWLTVPHQGSEVWNGEKQPGTVTVATENTPQPESEEDLLTYAYYDADFYGDESSEEEEEGFLPDDYKAIVSTLTLPDV